MLKIINYICVYNVLNVLKEEKKKTFLKTNNKKNIKMKIYTINEALQEIQTDFKIDLSGMQSIEYINNSKCIFALQFKGNTLIVNLDDKTHYYTEEKKLSKLEIIYPLEDREDFFKYVVMYDGNITKDFKGNKMYFDSREQAETVLKAQNSLINKRLIYQPKF